MELCNTTNYAYKNAFTIQFLFEISTKSPFHRKSSYRFTNNRFILNIHISHTDKLVHILLSEVKHMTEQNCTLRVGCTVLAIIASIIIGVITGFLSITAVITLTPAFLWVLLGIAVVYLAVLLIASTIFRVTGKRFCVCRTLPVLLTGILGTVLTSVILLGITFAATSIAGTIITAALLTFFSLIVTATACLIKCLAGCSEY